MMRFHGILLVRDEGDIIEEMLKHALVWADTIWALDTGSTDGTYERMASIAAHEPRLRLLGRHELLFSQSIRAFVFDRARCEFRDGDWVVKLDADEFFHIPPPQFVEQFVEAPYGCVYLRWYYFRMTADELADYDSGPLNLQADRSRPIADRRRFYKTPTHAEPRLFKYRASMKFRSTAYAPRFAGPICPVRIPIRHYPHRDPAQLRKRFELRAAMKQKGSGSSAHWDHADWRRDILVRAGDRWVERHDGVLAFERGHTDSDLQYWRPGEDLPDLTRETMASPAPLRAWLSRRSLYRLGVRLADRFVEGFDDPMFLERWSIDAR